MDRRAFCRRAATKFLALPLALTAAAVTPSQAVTIADLQAQLEKGLRARRPVEFAFIAKVIALVNERKLPVPLVNSAYDYARHKLPYPFPYFEAALRLRAKKIGVVI